jgi:hypothetical protein
MPAMIDFKAEITISHEPSSRTYACPECSREDPDEKLDIFGSETVVRNMELERYASADLRRAVHESMATGLAHEFLKRGLINFREEPRGDQSTAIRARIGIVSPKRIASVEARATDKMRDFLDGVIEEAAGKIYMWGSHYTGNDGFIEKPMAVGFVRAAFNESLRKIREKIR